MTLLESTSADCGLATIAAIVGSTPLTISTAEDSARTEAFDINNRGQIVGVAGNIPPGAGAQSEGQPSAQQDGMAMGAMALMGMRPGRAAAAR